MKKIIPDKGITLPATKTRLDIFLSKKKKISRSRAQKMIEAGLILINNELPQKAGERISASDTITITKTARLKESLNKKQKNIKILKYYNIGDIKNIAETPDYIVVEKPRGMLTHSTMKNEPDSLAALLVKKYPELKKVGDDPARPGIVHRLDKEASGLLVVARTQKMFNHLKEQFKNRAVDKEYSVLAHGQVQRDWERINFPIIRSKNADRMSALPATAKGLENTAGKQALTEFWVEKKFINFTLLRVKIHTGRMHQIRAHMLAYNHPVVGDPLYFQKKLKRKWDERLGRLFLHCTKLAFTDLNGEQQTFESPLPKELSDFLILLK